MARTAQVGLYSGVTIIVLLLMIIAQFAARTAVGAPGERTAGLHCAGIETVAEQGYGLARHTPCLDRNGQLNSARR